MQIEQTGLDGVVILKPRVFSDDRGFFLESFNQGTFTELGLPGEWVQDNHSFSSRGVLRGLHYQYPQWQGKLVRAIFGEIFDVAVDIRRNSPSFGKWYGAVLSRENQQMLYVPAGFAHGFCVLSDTADVLYKCTTPYAPEQDRCILWNDPDIGIAWPIKNPVLSEKDQKGALLKDVVLDGT
ncbi:MAG: dTDP-4-dehydrorhamnose 3,5-epimerase [Gammaproteobacteria bacterium]|jgi:dTDP-4-dehydrorhamnose 3,5-epimerase|nr:dTDP-4-dehydrorhamnose 3,5-epimerase [Gammaproteobacteria bacterium]